MHPRLVGQPPSIEEASLTPANNPESLSALRQERSSLQRKLDRLTPKVDLLGQALEEAQRALAEVTARHALVSEQLALTAERENSCREQLFTRERENHTLTETLRSVLLKGIEQCRKGLDALGHGVKKRAFADLSCDELVVVFSSLQEELIAQVTAASHRHAKRADAINVLRAEIEVLSKNQSKSSQGVTVLEREISQIVATLPTLSPEERRALGDALIDQPDGAAVFTGLAKRLRHGAGEALERDDIEAHECLFDTLNHLADLTTEAIERRGALPFLLGVGREEAAYLIDRVGEPTLRILLGCYLADPAHAHVRTSRKFLELLAASPPQARALVVERSDDPQEQLEALFALPALRKTLRSPFVEGAPQWEGLIDALEDTVAALPRGRWSELRSAFLQEAEPLPETLAALGITLTQYTRLKAAIESRASLTNL